MRWACGVRREDVLEGGPLGKLQVGRLGSDVVNSLEESPCMKWAYGWRRV